MLCALTQNMAFGTLFGSFGPLLPSTVERFGISLATATMAMSMATLGIAASAPLVGVAVHRLSAGTAMAIAAALSACCYGAIAVTHSFAIVLACYAVLGICAVTLGIIGPVTLVNQVFSANRGKMLGLLHMPIFLMVAPIVVAQAYPQFGRTGILLAIGAMFALLVPLIWLLTRGSPGAAKTEQVAQADRCAKTNSVRVGGRQTLALVLLSLAVGVISSSSIVYMAHIVPFGLSRGLTLSAASLLISLFSGSGIVGSPVAGWLCDRLGPYWTLSATAVAIAILWVALPGLNSFAIFFGVSCLGFFAAPINTLHAAAVSSLYGHDQVGKAMGMSYLIKLPLLFGMAPLVALFLEHFESYSQGFAMLAAITVASAVLSGGAMVVARSTLRPTRAS